MSKSLGILKEYQENLNLAVVNNASRTYGDDFAKAKDLIDELVISGLVTHRHWHTLGMIQATLVMTDMYSSLRIRHHTYTIMFEHESNSSLNEPRSIDGVIETFGMGYESIMGKE